MSMDCSICKRPVHVPGGAIGVSTHVECENSETLEALRNILFGTGGTGICSKCSKPSDWLMVIINQGRLEFHCRKCSVDQVVFNSGYGDEKKPGSDVPF